MLRHVLGVGNIQIKKSLKMGKIYIKVIRNRKKFITTKIRKLIHSL